MKYLTSLSTRQRDARRLAALRRDPHLARDIGLEPLPPQPTRPLVQW